MSFEEFVLKSVLEYPSYPINMLNISSYHLQTDFTEGYILCSSVEYNSPRYNSLTSLLVLPMDDNFSSTTSREVCTLYWNCNSSSGFRHDMYLGEFWKEMQQNLTWNFKIEQKEYIYSYLLYRTEPRSQNT